MRSLSAARAKKVSWRSRARIQRSATCTATSTFALSAGLPRARREDDRAVVLGQLLVGALKPGS